MKRIVGVGILLIMALAGIASSAAFVPGPQDRLTQIWQAPIVIVTITETLNGNITSFAITFGREGQMNLGFDAMGGHKYSLGSFESCREWRNTSTDQKTIECTPWSGPNIRYYGS